EVNLREKNQLLGGARALLFPIHWEEPFGLVMIEAMACGAPVLAFPRGAVPEVVVHGVSGWVCRDQDEMSRRAAGPLPSPAQCRNHVIAHFGTAAMVQRYVSLYTECLHSSSVPARRQQALLPERLPLASLGLMGDELSPQELRAVDYCPPQPRTARSGEPRRVNNLTLIDGKTFLATALA